jgi:putative membrane protein
MTISRSLTQAEHDALANRIREAEAKTRGEIYCVVARRSDSYHFPAAFMLTAVMLIGSVGFALWIDRSWYELSHLTFVAGQIVAIGAGLLLAWLSPSLRIRLVPHFLRERRAHDNALKQFVAHNVHTTELRTGILIFVSLAERYAAVIADSGINEVVAQSEWDEIIASLTQAAKQGQLVAGLGDSIDRSGALLALHFPGGTNNPNELDDHVVEI